MGESDASDGADILAPPGSYPWGEGPYGTRDQAGNVAEWTADAYLTSNASGTAKRGYDELDSHDPVRRGQPDDPRVVRGGSWRQPMFVSRVNVRDPMLSLNALGLGTYEPNHRYPFVGFRCAGRD
jgi:formylglycine-generating enzyme required for sulfatase activity